MAKLTFSEAACILNVDADFVREWTEPLLDHSPAKSDWVRGMVDTDRASWLNHILEKRRERATGMAVWVAAVVAAVSEGILAGQAIANDLGIDYTLDWVVIALLMAVGVAFLSVISAVPVWYWAKKPRRRGRKKQV